MHENQLGDKKRVVFISGLKLRYMKYFYGVGVIMAVVPDVLLTMHYYRYDKLRAIEVLLNNSRDDCCCVVKSASWKQAISLQKLCWTVLLTMIQEN